MKKILLLFLILILPVTLISCKEDKENDVPPTPEPPVEVTEPIGVKIHYNRPDSAYETWGLWLWSENKEGALYKFADTDDYGAYGVYTFEELSTTKDGKIGFIIRKLDSWTKDYDSDRFIEFKNFEFDKEGYYNVYLKSKDANIYSNMDGEVNDMIVTFGFSYASSTKDVRIEFTTNKDFVSYKIYAGNVVLLTNEDPKETKLVEQTTKKAVYSLGTELPDLSLEYKVEVVFEKSGKTLTKIADFQGLYKSKLFNDAYSYDGDLGAIYTKDNTTFRVWSPISSDMKVRVYTTGTPANLGGNNQYEEYVMTKGPKGTWEYVLNGDQEGKYYTYVVSNSTYTNMEIVDPYAKSAGINGLRGMIVDFSKVNPTGWEDVNILSIPSTSLTVYETHIADLTSSKTWTGTAQNAKKFKGFYETGTTYTEGNVTVKTGFDHIKELGVNAVQLLPIFDQANEEQDGKVKFNWGYNPLNYNVLEGCYSSNATDGYARIKEFKELVMAYNQAGINIIMDVVYNHVSGLERSNFDVLMPKYYFRYTDGAPANGSGCGNETASEMSMFRKFMIDSTEFWASEYKLGGFRFDLMGIHDIKTMNALAKNLHENVSEDITIYGEPWAAGSVALDKRIDTPALQANMNLYQGYGCFNDKMRDALIKGGLNSKTSKGWITNATKVSSKNDLKDMTAGIKGLVLANNTTYAPEKCVNYVTCHDNYTLYDRIKAAGIKDEDTIKKMAMLSNSVVFTSQGVTFMLAGEEFLRTKGGDSNSYESSYKVNELDYALKVKNFAYFENYKKLISLKQNANLFGKNGTECKAINVQMNEDGSLIYYDLVDTAANKTYRIVHSNGVASPKTVDLAGYTLYLDTLNSNISLTAETTILGYQTIIAYKNME